MFRNSLPINMSSCSPINMFKHWKCPEKPSKSHQMIILTFLSISPRFFRIGFFFGYFDRQYTHFGLKTFLKASKGRFKTFKASLHWSLSVCASGLTLHRMWKLWIRFRKKKRKVNQNKETVAWENFSLSDIFEPIFGPTYYYTVGYLNQFEPN